MNVTLGEVACLDMPAIWLRDNCSCERCRDERNGQKLFQITDLPADLSIGKVEESEQSVTVTFRPDGHRSVFSRAWLEEMNQPAGNEKGLRRRLWRAGDLEDSLPRYDWAAYESQPAERLRVLSSVRDLGFAILAGTGVSEGTVLRVAETFGYVRRTNYGELFDVRTELDPSNLAFTGLAISPHTDNPYRDPVPTLQLLHCVQNAVEGGDTGLVDGFLAASLLADESPADLRLLASTPVPFAWCDATNTLRAEVPLIELDCRGEPRCVRFNNRSMEAIAGTPESLAAFYDAYRHFAEIVTREELRLSFRLEGGDCLMFDNRRVLHARTAFVDDTGGSRHLQGCYADVDGLLSSIAVLERVPARQSDGVS